MVVAMLLVAFYFAMGTMTVKAAPPPIVDADGNITVAPWNYEPKAVKLPTKTAFDRKCNEQSKAIRSEIKKKGWVMTGVERRGNCRVYTFSKKGSTYSSLHFELSQKVGAVKGKFNLLHKSHELGKYREQKEVIRQFKSGDFATSRLIY